MDKPSLVDELRERASYLEAFIPEGLSAIEWQSMEVMYKAANRIEEMEAALLKATEKTLREIEYLLKVAGE